MISSITVIASRGWSSLLTQVPDDCFSGLEHCFHGEVHHACSQTLGTWMFWVLIIVILVTAIWSALYLNKCMMCFGNTQVVPFYYCTFTTLSILGGGVVYKEFDVMTWQQGLMFGFGIVLAFSGVYLICANRKEAKEFNELPPEEKLGRIQSTGGLQPVGPLVGGTRRMTMNPRDVLEEATGRGPLYEGTFSRPASRGNFRSPRPAAAVAPQAEPLQLNDALQALLNEKFGEADVLLRAFERESSFVAATTPRGMRKEASKKEGKEGSPGLSPVTESPGGAGGGAATRRAHVTQLVVQLVATPEAENGGPPTLLELRSDMSNAVGDSAKSTASHWSATVGPAPRSKDGPAPPATPPTVETPRSKAQTTSPPTDENKV